MVKQRRKQYQSVRGGAWVLLVWMTLALACGAAEQAGRAGRRSAPPALEPRMMTLELERADIRTVLLYLAEVTGKAVVPARGLSGELSVHTDGMVSTGEIATLLMAALATNGFCVVDDGTCLRIVRAEDTVRGETAAAPRAGNERDRFTLQLDGMELRSIVALLAELTGMTIVPPAGMSGRVAVISPQPVTRREAIEIVYAVLETHGYSVVEYGTYAKIVRAQDAAGKPIRLRPPRTAPANLKEQ